MSKPRSHWQKIDGVLLLDKPQGISSNDALQKARRLYNAAKAGHTGTLDPMATGLLPLCFGEATKFAGELLEADKTYLATVQLGVTTDTADAEGSVLSRQDVHVTRADVEAALAQFRGDIEQTPPMYSALKRDGKPLYEYARAGIEVERAPRRVHIAELTLLQWHAAQDSGGEAAPPNRFDIQVSCSKGAYIRSLAADIGAALGCGAHLAALRRTRVGRLLAADALTLADLQACDAAALMRHLQAPDALLAALPRADLDGQAVQRMSCGQAVAWPGPANQRWRCYASAGEAVGRFMGLAQSDATGNWLQPKRWVSA